jgi:hypothetical protein
LRRRLSPYPLAGTKAQNLWINCNRIQVYRPTPVGRYRCGKGLGSTRRGPSRGAVCPSLKIRSLVLTANPSAATASTSIVKRASILCDLLEDSSNIEASFRLMQLACGSVPSRAQRAPKHGRLRRRFCRLQFHASFCSYISAGLSSPGGLEALRSGPRTATEIPRCCGQG